MGGQGAAIDAPWLRGYYADTTRKRAAGHQAWGNGGPREQRSAKLDPTSGINILNPGYADTTRILRGNAQLGTGPGEIWGNGGPRERRSAKLGPTSGVNTLK